MKTEKQMVIYSLTNRITNKKYVGSALDFNRRKRRHINLLRKWKHHSLKLQNSFNKYGEAAFEFEIIEVINDKKKLIETEQKWIDKLKPELNMLLIAGLNSHLGVKRSQETKDKIRKALTGKKQSSEHIEANRQGHLGLEQSDETKKKRAESCKNSEVFQKAVKSIERNQKIKKTRIENGGYIVTEEMKQQISKTLKTKDGYRGGHYLEVEKYDLNGKLIETYPSISVAEELNFITKGYLSKILKSNKNKIKENIWKLKEVSSQNNLKSDA